ncbi:hypothetical protein WKI11_12155 [Enterococcus avium]|uniref:hypothetical protein n=1 Tax=Enterococcus avium TaxID=33945 RepID=UPI0032E4B1C9
MNRKDLDDLLEKEKVELKDLPKDLQSYVLFTGFIVLLKSLANYMLLINLFLLFLWFGKLTIFLGLMQLLFIFLLSKVQKFLLKQMEKKIEGELKSNN